MINFPKIIIGISTFNLIIIDKITNLRTMSVFIQSYILPIIIFIFLITIFLVFIKNQNKPSKKFLINPIIIILLFTNHLKSFFMNLKNIVIKCKIINTMIESSFWKSIEYGKDIQYITNNISLVFKVNPANGKSVFQYLLGSDSSELSYSSILKLLDELKEKYPLKYYYIINGEDNTGATSIHYLIEGKMKQFDKQELYEYVSKDFYHYESTDENGNTIFHLLSKNGYYDLISKELLKFYNGKWIYKHPMTNKIVSCSMFPIINAKNNDGKTVDYVSH